MATKLEKTVKREVTINGEQYVVAITPEGVSLTQKRHRNPVKSVTWAEFAGMIAQES